jgi:hypothetical protein
MNINYLIYGSIGLGLLLLMTNFIDFSYLMSKLFFKNNNTVPNQNSSDKQKEFLEIVSLWYQLKAKCDNFHLDVASQKLDEVFPLLNGILEDEVQS